MFLVICYLLLLTPQGCSVFKQARRYPSTPGLQEKDVTVVPPQKGLRVGEKLIYTIRWVGVPVGTVTLWVREKGFLFEEKEVYHLTGEVKSNAFLSRFYKVADFYQSYWDVKQRDSRQFRKKVSQGRYRADEIITFYPDQKKGAYLAPVKQETKEFSIPGPVQDILSSIYYFRTIPYQTEMALELPLVADEKNWKVTLSTVKEGVLEVRNLGVYEAFLIEPYAIRVDPPDGKEGKPYRPKGRLWIWFSADEKRLPLVVRADTARVGEVTATLESVELAN